jgi:hypothetical protein
VFESVKAGGSSFAKEPDRKIDRRVDREPRMQACVMASYSEGASTGWDLGPLIPRTGSGMDEDDLVRSRLVEDIGVGNAAVGVTDRPREVDSIPDGKAGEGAGMGKGVVVGESTRISDGS